MMFRMWSVMGVPAVLVVLFLQTVTGNNSPAENSMKPPATQASLPQVFDTNMRTPEGDIRLVNGRGACSGRVEIQIRGQWGTVCDDIWNLNNAQVVCRQAGCGRAQSAPNAAHFGQGSGPIWLDDINCIGNESRLIQCSHIGLGTHNCGHNEDAGVVCAEPAPKRLTCGQDQIQIGLPLSNLEFWGLNGFSGHLADHRCTSFTESNGIVWYQVERRADTCGNLLTTNSTHATYSNSLFIYPENNASSPVSYPFSCAYPLDTDTSLDVVIRPNLELDGAISGVGSHASASMSLFQHSNYTEPYPAGPVTLPVGSAMHVGVSVGETDPRFAVVLDDCYATHSSNPDDLMRYFLIQNRCPSDRRQVTVEESGSSLQARFSALLFLFQGNYRDVYLHCNLHLCDRTASSCSPVCSRRERRSASRSTPFKPLTIGPITWDTIVA